MPRDGYMPRAEIDQVAWSQNLKDVVTPLAAAYGVPTAVMTSFATINDSLQIAWQTANLMNSRTRGSISDKNDALKAMKVAARQIVGLIQSNPAVTDQMKIDAKVTVRKTKPTPAPVPSVSPVIYVKSVSGSTVSIQLRQPDGRRSRPARVASASLFTAPAGVPITDASQWSFYTLTTKADLDVVFPPTSTGEAVQISAFWTNSRGESGPASQAVTVNLPATGVLPKGVQMRVAA